MSSLKDKVIKEAIEAGSYKQAITTLTKALKKSPNNEYLLSLKAEILFKQGKCAEALKEVAVVISKSPVDPKALELLNSIIVQSNGNPDLAVTMYENAYKKRPRDENLIVTWFWSMADIQNFRGLQKSAMMLYKSFKTPEYNLWAIFTSYLLANSTGVTEAEKKMFSTLALRMAESIHPYDSAEEIYVVAKLLELQDKSIEFLELLQSPETLKYNNLELAIMLREKLFETGRWNELFELCNKVLMNENNDDWMYWTYLNLSAINLSETYIETAWRLMKDYGNTRNSLLAIVDFSAQLSVTNDELLVQIGIPSLLDALKSYFEVMGTKLCAYQDLKKYLLESNDSIKAKWQCWSEEAFDKVQKSETHTLNWKVNLAKIEHLLFPENKSADAIVKQQCQNYNDSIPLLKVKDPKDYHAGDDFILIAMLAILEEKDDLNNQTILKAIILLETVASMDFHQFYVRLWLVRLYLLLGCYTKALVHYKSLSIKMIQQETLSHMLLTRVSTMYPTINELRENLYIYNSHANETPQLVQYAFETAAYSKISGFLKFADSMDHSLNKSLIELEIRRIGSLSGGKVTNRRIDTNKRLVDNRDFDIMWSLEKTGQIKLGDKFTLGPKQTANWVKAFEYKDYIICELLSDNLTKDDFKKFEKLFSGEDALEKFTVEEIWSLKLTLALGRSALAKGDKSYYDIINKQLKKTPSLPPQVNWKYIHNSFTQMEMVKVANAYLNGLNANKNQFKPNKDGVEMIKKTLNEISENIKTRSLEKKNARPLMTREIAEPLQAWAETVGVPTANINTIVDDIGASHDKAFTLLRNIKL
ncbi:hypothetical protein NADFUDRAFT_52979 [Nadsonia fulvescens var. elongata DSM 6958]|uniref:Uncharacterized protein n=1 Tax=Nadsonia fulvescens var. elongata DSM 6958 TaxID=857566 RepID=A0A1E3PFL7_9ASCO|nr:hypothetical protein NADFUDRAFT_52979 [Nadsonia fulvescens var. elongata DSM 6958]